MASRIRLRGISAGVESLRWEFARPFAVGRGPSRDVVLATPDNSVSRQHARIDPGEHDWFVRDLGSTNGTFLNGTRLAGEEHPLRRHDLLRFGNVSLLVDDLENTSGVETLDALFPASSFVLADTGNNPYLPPADGGPWQPAGLPEAVPDYRGFRGSDEDRLLAVLADAARLFDAHRADLFLHDPRHGAPAHWAAAAFELPHPHYPDYDTNAWRIVLERGCSVLQQEPDLPPNRPVYEGDPFPSGLHLALRRDGAVLATLHLYRSILGLRFGTDDLLRADAFAARAAAALPPPDSGLYRREAHFPGAALTEARWRDGADPVAMLRFLGKALGERRRYAFLLACVRRAWHLVAERPCRRAVEMLSCNLDGVASAADRAAACQAAQQFCQDQAPGNAAQIAADLCAPDADAAALANRLCHELAHAAAPPPQARPLLLLRGGGALIAGHWRVEQAERAAQAELLREVVSNPFRPVTVDPAWLEWNDGTVQRLALDIAQGRRFEDLPILADALEEAGCTEEDMLRHLRTPGGHAVGCWALDALLGRA